MPLSAIQVADLAAWQPVIHWQQLEGWELGLGDDACYFEASPSGFLLGYIDSQPVSSLSIVGFADKYAHVGHFLTAPGRRGRGFGTRLWEHCMQRILLLPSGLDAVLDQVGNYRTWGYITAYRTVHMVGSTRGEFGAFTPGIERISEVNLQDAISFDQEIVGYNRAGLLGTWFDGVHRWGYVARYGGLVVGLIGARYSTAGIKLGPVYAQDCSTLKVLYQAMQANIRAGLKISVDIPEYSRMALQLFSVMGFVRTFETCRMYRGISPQQNTRFIQAVASLDVG